MSAPRPVREVARLLGVSHQSVLAAVERGRLGASVARDEAGRLRGLRWPQAREEWERNRQQPAARGAPSPVADAALEEKLWKVRLLALEYEKRSTQLVEAAEVDAAVVPLIAACRERILAVVGAAHRRLPHLAAGDLAVLEALLREALQELDSLEGRL